MKVKALKSFSGAVNMSRGQVMNIQNEYVLHDLLKAGYVEPLEEGNAQVNAILNEEAGAGSAESDAEETLTGTLDTEDLKAMHKNDLKKLAGDMGLDDGGTKDELVERIAMAKAEAGVVE